ncbi:hypothetical protein D3C73_1487890 [compost metagenome]
MELLCRSKFMVGNIAVVALHIWTYWYLYLHKGIHREYIPESVYNPCWPCTISHSKISCTTSDYFSDGLSILLAQLSWLVYWNTF